MAQYVYKTKPYEHQRKIFTESVGKAGVSLFLSPGTGKSFIIINKAAFLYQQGKIDALVIVAPNGVHRNWASDEIPAQMPDETFAQSKLLVYQSSKAKNKQAEIDRKDLIDHKGLSILLVSYEAAITDTLKAYMKRFLTKRKAMMVLDESHRIKSANSQVKKTLVAMGHYAPYRRILSGTPVEKPVDLYSQIRFILPDFWKSKGLATKTEFDAMFCVYAPRRFGTREFKQVVGYQNLDTLSRWVRETGYQLTMDDVGIHLPPMTFSKRYCTLTPEQRRVYEEFAETMRVELASGDILKTNQATTRLIRLQQIICGYVACEAEQPVQRINPDGKNPRLEVAVDDILLDLPHQAIVWARFTEDINQLMGALGKDAVRYDGQVDGDDRARAKAAFQAGDKKYIVMSDAGSEGLTLIGAETSVFYSNNYVSIKRQQKLFRNHRIGQNKPVHVIDLVCENTVDEAIIDALREKKDIAELLIYGKVKI